MEVDDAWAKPALQFFRTYFLQFFRAFALPHF
jgi:hypothetical protein